MAQFAQYAMAATEEALEDAAWKPTSHEEREMTVCFRSNHQGLHVADQDQGVCLGSGIGNFDEIYDTVVAYEKNVRIG
jgi:3-oxoacyl-[acyl-carrier-protein] synthase II